MKTMIKKIAVAILITIITSAQVLAFEDSLKVKSGNSINLVINDVYRRTQITFKDGHNNILFEQTINKTEKFTKTFNLELLSDGDYTVEIDDDTRIKILTVNILKNVVCVPGSEMNEYFKPVVSEKGTMVYVSQFSPNRTPLHVAIYNNKNNLIHEETLKGKMDLGKIFDFSKSMSGKYRIYLESEGMRYDHLVYIEK